MTTRSGRGEPPRAVRPPPGEPMRQRFTRRARNNACPPLPPRCCSGGAPLSGQPGAAVRRDGRPDLGTADGGRQSEGRPRSALETIIPAVAEANHCIVVTANERDFDDVQVINPLHGTTRPSARALPCPRRCRPRMCRRPLSRNPARYWSQTQPAVIPNVFGSPPTPTDRGVPPTRRPVRSGPMRRGYFGDSTITICRFSSRGICSTLVVRSISRGYVPARARRCPGAPFHGRGTAG